jgi:hypothetical protein
MRWPTKPRAHHRDERTVRRFAWYPVRCNDGSTRWLEWVIYHEQYLCGWDGCSWFVMAVNPEKPA